MRRRCLGLLLLMLSGALPASAQIISGPTGGTPSAPTGSIQYNNAGAFGGANFLFNPTDSSHAICAATCATIKNSVDSAIQLISTDGNSALSLSAESTSGSAGSLIEVISQVTAPNVQNEAFIANPEIGGNVAGGGDCFVLGGGPSCSTGFLAQNGDIATDTVNGQDIVGFLSRPLLNKVATHSVHSFAGFEVQAPKGNSTGPLGPVLETAGTGYGLYIDDLGGLTTIEQAPIKILAQTTPGAGLKRSIDCAIGCGLASFGDGLAVSEGTAPTGTATLDNLYGDSATHTWSYNENNNGNSSFTGAWNCTNVTPVTVSANVTTDQNLMTCTVPAGRLNRVGRSIKVHIAGVYSTPAASVATVNLKIKLGTLTLLSITSSANPGSVTNNKFLMDGWETVQTAGATAAFESSGDLTIDLGALNTSPDSIFADTNIATVSSIDTTASQTLQVTVAFSAASASNLATERQLIVETVN
jgi:hypothetical protein